MQQRREPSDSFDYFPTPLWATRALCEWLGYNLHVSNDETVLEPACGEGHMVRALKDYFLSVSAYDIQPMGYGKQADYLFPSYQDDVLNYDWVITNPPFKLAEQFIEKALRNVNRGACFLTRTSFLEGVGRHNRLFSKTPPSYVLQFSERVPMLKGRVDKKASTATSYAWLVWVKPLSITTFDWIPPCRKRLEKEGDYA